MSATPGPPRVTISEYLRRERLAELTKLDAIQAEISLRKVYLRVNFSGEE